MPSRNKKERIPIPDSVASEILYLSDRTCCVCAEKGKAIQIHHIDELPSNNSIDNLSVLCLDCHNDTQIQGGFGRKLGAELVRKYKKEWLKRVSDRREKADKDASIIYTKRNNGNIPHLNYRTTDSSVELDNYLERISIFHSTAEDIAQIRRNSGTTSEMIQSNYEMIDFYEKVLIELSTFYPKNHFNNVNPIEYFSEVISSKFIWHRAVVNPKPDEAEGNISQVLIGAGVMVELKEMVIEMVRALELPYNLTNTESWTTKWRRPSVYFDTNESEDVFIQDVDDSKLFVKGLKTSVVWTLDDIRSGVEFELRFASKIKVTPKKIKAFSYQAAEVVFAATFNETSVWLPFNFTIGIDTDAGGEQRWFKSNVKFLIGQYDIDKDGIDEIFICLQDFTDGLLGDGLEINVLKFYPPEFPQHASRKENWEIIEDFKVDSVLGEPKAIVSDSSITIPRNLRSYYFERTFVKGAFRDTGNI